MERNHSQGPSHTQMNNLLHGKELKKIHLQKNIKNFLSIQLRLLKNF